MKKQERIVVALGGNAILQAGQEPTYETQLENIEMCAKLLAGIVEDGNELIIGHGNGPQIGNLLVQNEEAKNVIPPMPMDVLNGETQGFIGYMLVQSLNNELAKRNVNTRVVNLLTRIEVSKEDERFKNPSKPVGTFYTKEEADKLAEDKGFIMKEDAGRGYRRVVPSPLPQKILEADTIKLLVENGLCVVAGGGGGIPVYEEDGEYKGLEAVIDKDFSCCRMAKELEADKFMILTDVKNACVNYKKENEEPIGRITVAEMEKHIANDEFAPGSMKPKVEAAVDFAKSTGKEAYICSLSDALEVLKGNGGTTIIA